MESSILDVVGVLDLHLVRPAWDDLLGSLISGAFNHEASAASVMGFFVTIVSNWRLFVVDVGSSIFDVAEILELPLLSVLE